jgi:hypothetical protein
MTAEERAEKLVSNWSTPMILMGLTEAGAVKAIAAQIEEAEREAHHNSSSGKCNLCHEAWKLGFSAGFTSAKEKAKGIALTGNTNMIAVELPDGSWESRTVGQWISDRIAKTEPNE